MTASDKREKGGQTVTSRHRCPAARRATTRKRLRRKVTEAAAAAAIPAETALSR